jgi:tetratricopeptide (TPR) repeat protein
MRREVVIAGAVVLAAGIGLGTWALTRGAGAPRPPDPDAYEPAVAALIESACVRVDRHRRDPAAWRHLAMVYDANELHELALTCYERALVQGDDDPRTPYHMGVVATRLGHLDRAAAALERAAEAEPNDAPTRWRLGLIRLDQGRLEDAWEAFSLATALDPRDSAGWLGMARVHLEQDENQEAADLLEQLLGWTDSNLGYGNQLLAVAYRRLGRVPEADAAAYRGQGAEAVWNDIRRLELMALRPGYTPRLRAAAALARAGRLEESTRLLEELHRDFPDRATVAINLANNYRILGRLTESAAILEELLAVMPEDHRVHYSLAGTYGKMSQGAAAAPEDLIDWRGRAVAHAEQALALNPGNTGYHGVYADLLVLDGRVDDAIAHYLAAGSRGSSPNWLLKAAALQVNLGRLDEAERTLDRAAAAGAPPDALRQAHEQLDLIRELGSGR